MHIITLDLIFFIFKHFRPTVWETKDISIGGIYNFQDTAILCEIFESRSALFQKLFKYNPKKCNSASSFSGCVHRLKSKCRIVLQTNAEAIKVFEKTVLGGYSCINTRMRFD